MKYCVYYKRPKGQIKTTFVNACSLAEAIGLCYISKCIGGFAKIIDCSPCQSESEGKGAKTND